MKVKFNSLTKKLRYGDVVKVETYTTVKEFRLGREPAVAGY